MSRKYKNADGLLIPTDTAPPALIHWALQPALMALVGFSAVGMTGLDAYTALGLSLIALTVAERIWPARREWTQTTGEWLQVVMMFAISAAALFAVEIVPALLSQHLSEPRGDIMGAIEKWPLIVQVILAYSILQFCAYWTHRWQHEIGWMWRAFGHGTHHTYTKLSAMNWNTAHPFEALFLAGPAVLLAWATGLQVPVLTAAALVMLVTAIAHTNLRLNERFIGFVLTTNSQHMQHHSAKFDESQTNYGCGMIFWDRVFGTFSPGPTKALGDAMEGERTLWRRLTVPLKR